MPWTAGNIAIFLNGVLGGVVLSYVVVWLERRK